MDIGPAQHSHAATAATPRCRQRARPWEKMIKMHLGENDGCSAIILSTPRTTNHTTPHHITGTLTMSDSAVLPPQQHSQPSRKGKKAWRKNVNVTEIESGLEEVREEIIKGYPVPPILQHSPS
jgi:hypothetical protein